MTSVEDKLKKFQSVCEDKIRKIELLKKQGEENDKIIKSFRNDTADECEVTLLNLQLAQVLHESAQMKDEIRKEQDYQQEMRIKIEQSNLETDEAFALLVDMVKGVSTMKGRLLQRVRTITDMVNSRRENYLMTLEEQRTYQAMTHEVRKGSSESNQHIEWLKKLVNATQIQTQEAERRLVAQRRGQLLH